MVSNREAFRADPSGVCRRAGIVWKIRMQESDGLAVEILTLGADEYTVCLSPQRHGSCRCDPR